MARVQISITGFVQGVFFRREITNLAHRLGVSGSVRNLRDGRVEVLAEGEKDSLNALLRFCHVGPPGARVKSVIVVWSEFRGEYHGFRIAH
ncbi:MAG TPA: acylphosphatase [Candidatus Bathyarchaeia archaeon]|jgi:acylphosphatase|nr:acylphosphatase [Candidatus Bathyarchaeia archaeon]